MKGKVVIIGSGALSLGFLGERLSTDYEITFADKAVKSLVLKSIKNEKQYCLNVCHLDRIEMATIKGHFEALNIDNDIEKNKFTQAIKEADLIFTAVGNRNLPAVISQITPIVNEKTNKCYILLCENGHDLAKIYQKNFQESIVVDTVMSRMCRFAESGESGYLPFCGSYPDKLVVESYKFIPFNQKIFSSGHFSNVFTPVEPDIFNAWDDIKFYAHNGIHAFVAYHAFLERTRYFSDVNPKLKDKTTEMLFQEICPALHRAHPNFQYPDLEEYAVNLLKRIFNPYFHDSVDRGIRGVIEKLKPNERLISGLRFIYDHGFIPTQYASTIRAGYEIASSMNLVSENLIDFLKYHCSIVEDELIRIILNE